MAPQRHLTVDAIPRHYARRNDTASVVAVTTDDATLTWAQLDERASAVAAGLQRRGVRPGDRVAVLLPNCSAYLELMYGIARAGAVIVPINSRFVAREIEYCLGFAQASVLVTSDDHVDDVKSVIPALPALNDASVFVTSGDPLVGRPYDELRAPAIEAAVDVDPDSLYWLPFTSGTTGDAKAAVVTHRNLVAAWNSVVLEFDVTSDERELIAGPFYHSLGFLFGLAVLYRGGRIIVHREFDAARVLQEIQVHEVSMAPMVPTMYTMLLGAARASTAITSSLRKLISAGSPLLTATKNEVLDRFPSAGIYEMYGSTEMGMCTVLRPGDQRRKTRSVGQAILGSEIRLVDDDGRPVSAGEIGEIQKRGLLLSSGYYENPEANRLAMHDGWMSSGDLGVFDEEGYLSIIDRKKDMIISGGANVFPAEIEEVIASHPAVSQVSVIGVPDEKWGEAVTAVVVPAESPALDEEQLLDWCRVRLAGYKRPRRVEFVEALPTTGSGKVLKGELRRRYWQSTAYQVG